MSRMIQGLFLTVYLTLLAGVSIAQWPTTVEEDLLVDPVGSEVFAVPFHDNGTLVTYLDGPPGMVYQIIDQYGQLVFPQAPLLNPAYGSTYPLKKAKPDGRGGIIVSWLLPQGGSPDDDGIYAQRIDSLGNVCWSDSGKRVLPLISSSNTWDFCEDGFGGWYFVATFATDSLHVQIQHLDPDGNATLPDSGMTIFTQVSVFSAEITHDGNGGCYIVWRGNYGGPFGAAYRQHFDASYQPMWNPQGVLIDEETFNYQLLPDGYGGLLLFATPDNADEYTLFRYAPDGSLIWQIERLCQLINNERSVIIPGEPDYYYIGSADNFGFNILYGQRIDIDGNIYWPHDPPATGAIFASSDDFILELHPTFAFCYPYFYAFYGFRRYQTPWPTQHFVQRLDLDGNRCFGEDGTHLFDIPAGDELHYLGKNITPDGTGGAVMTWDLDFAREVYAKRVNDDGSIGGPDLTSPPLQPDPEGGTPFLSVSNQTITYTLSIPGEVSIELYNVLGRQLSSTSFFHQQAGVFTTPVFKEELVSGIYFLVITTPIEKKVLKFPIVN